MTHEPECPLFPNDTRTKKCICSALRIAYMRGRSEGFDVANDIIKRAYQHGRRDAARDAEINSRKPSSSRETMIVAARGESE